MRRVGFSKRSEKDKHDQMVKLVNRMIDLAPRLQTVHSDAERATIQNNLTSTDRKIDALAYELYGISETEQKMIEEGTIPKQLAGRKRRSQIAAAKATKAGARPKSQKKHDLQPTLLARERVAQVSTTPRILGAPDKRQLVWEWKTPGLQRAGSSILARRAPQPER